MNVICDTGHYRLCQNAHLVEVNFELKHRLLQFQQVISGLQACTHKLTCICLYLYSQSVNILGKFSFLIGEAAE